MAFKIKISSGTPIYFTLKFDVNVYALFWKRKEKNLGFTDVSKTLKKIFFLYKVYKTDDLPLKFQTAVEMLKTRWPLTFLPFMHLHRLNIVILKYKKKLGNLFGPQLPALKLFHKHYLPVQINKHIIR